MRLPSQQLIDELATVVDRSLAIIVIESYEEMQRRFLVGDWQPTELDSGRLCEAISRCLLQMDTGRVSHSKTVAEIRKILLDNSLSHTLKSKDRHHIIKVVDLVYKFRSDRGAVHISPDYTANQMDSMLVLHAGKWMLGEFLRLAWNKDEKVIADTIAQLVQLEHSIIHELDGKPLVLVKGISAPDEILLLLNHANGNRLTRKELQVQAANQKPQNIAIAIGRLIDKKEIRPLDGDEVALTPNGQKRVLEEIMPKITAKK
ncbi:MAG TPA: hypothetical protein VF666_15230 [Pyrinomonadaceae bacterium]|jgi:hypothetical protein